VRSESKDKSKKETKAKTKVSKKFIRGVRNRTTVNAFKTFSKPDIVRPAEVEEVEPILSAKN
jgi:hypothetical protein